MLDGGFFGVMLGVGETFLPAFALAIGLGEVVSGLVTSLPIFFGGIVQFVSLRALSWTGSYKRWIIAGVTRLIIYQIFMQACVQFSGPYFVPNIWWIAHFGTSIESYHSIFIISSLSRVLCVGLLWRVVAKR